MHALAALFVLLAQTGAGKIAGKVTLSGLAPKLAPLPVTRDMKTCGTTKPDESLEVGQGGGVKNAVLWIAALRGRSLDEFHPGPYAAGILPAASRATDPFTKDRPCCNEASFIFGEFAGKRLGLRCRPHAGGNQRTKKIRRNGKA